MLHKLVDIGSFYREDDIPMRIITPGRPVEGLVKSAAQKDIDDYVTSRLNPEPGKIYLHVNAMGAGEYYGSNKNGDWFPEEQLILYHKTFEEHGYVYRHHVNTDPATAIGRVLFAIYNYDMHRVEVVEEIFTDKAKDVVERIARGDYPSTSMACKTPWDQCSICGNQARSVKAYCEHLRKEMNRLYADGRRVMALNLAKLTFFDMSMVLRPADVTSSVLRKVANAHVVPSAVLGEEAGLSLEEPGEVRPAEAIKQAAFRKMADLIKEVPGGSVMAADKSLQDLLKSVSPVSSSLAGPLLHMGGFNQVMNALADLRMIPSLEFLAEMIAKVQGIPGEGIGELVGRLLPNLPLSALPVQSATLVPDVYPEQTNHWLLKELAGYQDQCSALPTCVEKRAYFPQDVPWGYVPPLGSLYGGGPSSPAEPAISPTLMDHLLALAGGAIVARFLLHSLVADKSRLKSGYGSYQVKQASDSPITNKLLEASLRRDLSRLKPAL